MVAALIGGSTIFRRKLKIRRLFNERERCSRLPDTRKRMSDRMGIIEFPPSVAAHERTRGW